jgi:excinuclease ABC subunit B
VYDRDYQTPAPVSGSVETCRTRAELDARIAELERDMKAAAANLEFERAAGIRDGLRRLRDPGRVIVGGSAE